MSHTDRPKSPVASHAWWAAALTLCCAAPGHAAPSACTSVDIAPVVKVPLGKSTVVRPKSAIQRIVLGSSGSARAADAQAGARQGAADVDVMLLSPNEVYLLGKSLGSTNVVLMDRNGLCTAFDVLVSMDALGLQSLVQELLPAEKGVKVGTANDAIVLSGEVSDNESLTRVVDLAQAFGASGPDGKGKVINMLSVAAPQQVMLEVKVAEISKTLLDEFGIDFSRTFVNAQGTSVQALGGLLGGSAFSLSKLTGAGSGVPLSSAGTVVGGNLSSGNLAAGNITSTPVFDSAGRFLYNNYTTSYGTVPARSANNLQLKMQKTDGLVKVLAEPTIMAISGQTGSFLAGGKIFIPVSQSNNNGSRDVTLEEKEFGVSVRFTPTVLGGGRINLHVKPEVSELNPAGVTLSTGNGTAVLPSFTSRKAETTVQLADGQSFAIGGLVKNNASTSISAFPFLGEIPVIGALFRSSQFQTDRTELVFVITPRLVKPLPANYTLPTDGYVPPNRGDVILRGQTEGIRQDGADPATTSALPRNTPASPLPAAQAAGFDVPPVKEKP